MNSKSQELIKDYEKNNLYPSVDVDLNKFQFTGIYQYRWERTGKFGNAGC